MISGSNIVKAIEEHKHMVTGWQARTVLEAAISSSNMKAAIKDGESRHVLIEKDFTREL